MFELREPCAAWSLRRLVERSEGLRAALTMGSVRDAFAWLLTAAPAEQALAREGGPPAGPAAAARVAGHGHVDVFGFHSAAHAWVFCGWIDPVHPGREAESEVQAIAHFEHGKMQGVALIGHFSRDDLSASAAGFVLALEGPGQALGELQWLSLRAGEQSWTLLTGGARGGLRDEALMSQLRPLAGQLHAGAARSRVVALLERRGYTGENTLSALRDRVFLEIDQTIFCPPGGVVLAGWMLAEPGAVVAIRLHCGQRVATLDPDRFLWLDRADVRDSVGAANGLAELRCGFIAFADGMFTPGEPVWLAIETRRGETGFRGLTTPILSGMAAIRFLLESFDLRYDALVRGMGDVVGPAVRALNRARLQDRPAPRIIRFGAPEPDAAVAAPEVSVIVPLYGRLDFMEYQFALGSRHQPTIAREFIYVLDEPGRQREAEMLAASVFARFGVPFSLVLMPRNLGYAPANNAGLAVARGRHVCFLNSDVFADTPDWLERLVARLRGGSFDRRDRAAAAVRGPLRPASGHAFRGAAGVRRLDVSGA